MKSTLQQASQAMLTRESHSDKQHGGMPYKIFQATTKTARLFTYNNSKSAQGERRRQERTQRWPSSGLS